MDTSELRGLSVEELNTKLDDLRQELFNLKFQNATAQLDNPKKLGQTKKDIARVLTVMREIELAGQ